jgi:hypothetical protein
MTYRTKYLSQLKNPNLERGRRDRGQRPDPALWADDDVVMQRDIYYAWLKHRSQARYRGEEYELTAEQWTALWPKDVWLNRGRAPECDMLVRLDPSAAWTLNNVKIVKVKDKGKYYDDKRKAQQ